MTVIGAGIVACPRCGLANQAGSRYCAGCGGPIALAGWGPAGGGPFPSFPIRPSDPADADRHAGLEWAAALVAVSVFALVSILIALFLSRLPDIHYGPTIWYYARIDAGEALSLRVRADNPGRRASEPLWMVVRWAQIPAGGVAARMSSCDPACTYRDDSAAGTTYIRWDPLAAGDQREMIARFQPVDPPAAGDSLSITYDVAVGAGPSIDRIVEVRSWRQTTLVDGGTASIGVPSAPGGEP